MTNDPSARAHHWQRQLSKVQLPVLSGVMKELNAVAQSSDSSANQLSEIILRDAALTQKVLRIANSAYHNPSSDNAITTISRAVIQLGFQGIKAISLSVMMVDSLLKQENKKRMLEWMARGFHTAVQAESLMQQSGGNNDDEEVFITALLMHVGDMAFWSMKGEETERLDAALGDGEAINAEVEQQILGATLKQISVALADEWQLGDDVKSVLSPGSQPELKTEVVLLGEKITLAAEKGWDSSEFTDVLVEASLFSGVALEDMRQHIMAGAEKAASVALTYGANKVCQYIPTTVAKKAEPEQAKGLKADPKLQLDILREMGVMVQQRVDVNSLFQMVIEGIHRGIGLERVSLALVDPKITTMHGKYFLGEGVERWREELKMPVKSEQDNAFAYCLHRHQVVWFQRRVRSDVEHLINKKMRNLIDVDNCMISALYAGNRPIGVLLADRGLKGPAITKDQHESFCHFTQQTSMSLAMLVTKKAR